MTNRIWLAWLFLSGVVFVSASLLANQPGQEKKKEPDFKDFGKKDFFGKGGPGPMGQRRKLIPQFDKDGDGRLNDEERRIAREFLQKNPGKGGPGGFGKGGFGPGTFMAKPLVETLDTDKDGSLTKAEFLVGVKKFFADNDQDKKGALTQEQIAAGLERILPQAKGFFPKDGPKGPKDGKDFPKDAPKGPPGGGVFFFVPGKMLAGAIMQRADTKKSGTVTLADLEKAADTLFSELDKDKKGKLDEAAVAQGINLVMPPPNFGGPGGFGGKRDPAKPGPKVTPADVKSYPDKTLYDPTILRTIFLEFDNRKDWEAELADFYHTDVEVPATVIVDGKTYKHVGVHFRGNSSYFGVPAGYKHSLNLAFDFVDSKQKLYNFKTLNLLNCNQDPTFMHSALYCNIAGKYMPALKANLVKVVINGESWGIFANQQQFNKDFVKENFKTTNGARWKVAGHPGAANAGLSYLGENIADYKRIYQIKSKDNDKDWKALIELCRVLAKTPADKLEEALQPILDIDSVLWWLALDNAVVNDDGYWTRASDYNLYRSPKGKFYIVQSDTNETFFSGFGGFGGPGGKDFKGPKDGKEFKGPKDGGFGGFKGGPGGGGLNLDPLVGINDSRAPLRSKLLAVPSLRAKYLKNMHTIASEAFDWKNLGPMVAQYRTLIEKEVELDTRKLSSLADFRNATADTPVAGSRMGLRAFADGRRTFLLNHAEIKKVVQP
jgi:hypothetical protein